MGVMCACVGGGVVFSCVAPRGSPTQQCRGLPAPARPPPPPPPPAGILVELRDDDTAGAAAAAAAAAATKQQQPRPPCPQWQRLHRRFNDTKSLLGMFARKREQTAAVAADAATAAAAAPAAVPASTAAGEDDHRDTQAAEAAAVAGCGKRSKPGGEPEGAPASGGKRERQQQHAGKRSIASFFDAASGSTRSGKKSK